MAMAQDVVQSGQEPSAGPGPGGSGENPFSGRYVITFSPGDKSLPESPGRVGRRRASAS